MKNPPKWIWAVLIVVILAVIFIFSQVNGQKEPEYSFEATVLEVGETSIFVDVTSGDMSLGEAEVLTENIKKLPELTAGMKIKVGFNGISTRSLPPQVPGADTIEVLK